MARQTGTLRAGMYLVGTIYNFCTLHAGLTLADRYQTRRTPAMAAGLTTHRWTVTEVLAYKVPPVRWQPPKKRGRRSATEQVLIQLWAA